MAEEEENDEADNEGDKGAGGDACQGEAGGFADLYRNMSQGDCQAYQAHWIGLQDERWGRLDTWMGQQDQRASWMYDHTVRQFQYLSTRNNLKPHL
ncbi:hypothetical protein Tco_0131640, partial [Tanacetum coccineum]